MTSFWFRGIKCVIFRLDTIFSKTHVARLMVLELNFCQRDIRSADSNIMLCQEVKKWQWLIVSTWRLIEMSWEIVVSPYGNMSNFKFGERRCSWGNSINNSIFWWQYSEVFLSYWNFPLITIGDETYEKRVKGRALARKD